MLKKLPHLVFFLPFRAKPWRPRHLPARPQREPPQPKRSLLLRVTPRPLRPRARQRPAWDRAMLSGQKIAALHPVEAQVTPLGGNWACPPPPPQLLRHCPQNRLERMPLCCGWTNTVRNLWRLWLVSRETRAVPASCCAGCRTGTNTMVGGPPSRQVADSLTQFVF